MCVFGYGIQEFTGATICMCAMLIQLTQTVHVHGWILTSVACIKISDHNSRLEGAAIDRQVDFHDVCIR